MLLYDESIDLMCIAIHVGCLLVCIRLYDYHFFSQTSMNAVLVPSSVMLMLNVQIHQVVISVPVPMAIQEMEIYALISMSV